LGGLLGVRPFDPQINDFFAAQVFKLQMDGCWDVAHFTNVAFGLYKLVSH